MACSCCSPIVIRIQLLVQIRKPDCNLQSWVASSLELAGLASTPCFLVISMSVLRKCTCIMLHHVYVCATGQSDEAPAKSAESDPMSAAPTGLSGNARLVVDSLAADADMPQASSLATHLNGASHRCAFIRLQISSLCGTHQVCCTMPLQ